MSIEWSKSDGLFMRLFNATAMWTPVRNIVLTETM